MSIAFNVIYEIYIILWVGRLQKVLFLSFAFFVQRFVCLYFVCVCALFHKFFISLYHLSLSVFFYLLLSSHENNTNKISNGTADVKNLKKNSQRLWLAMHSIKLHRRQQADTTNRQRGPHMLRIWLWWIIMGIDFIYTASDSSDANICTYTMTNLSLRQTKHRIYCCCFSFGMKKKKRSE